MRHLLADTSGVGVVRNDVDHVCNLPGCYDVPTMLFPFVDPGTAIDGGWTCRWCRTLDEVMDGDGPVVMCRGCAAILGKIICQPDSVDGGAAADELAARHRAVVHLERRPNGERVWRWTGAWPGVERRVGGA